MYDLLLIGAMSNAQGGVSHVLLMSVGYDKLPLGVNECVNFHLCVCGGLATHPGFIPKWHPVFLEQT